MEALEQAVYFLAAKQGISKEEMKKKIKSSTDNIWQFTLANMSSKHPEEARFMDFAGLIAEIEVRLNEN
jgi:hypothetical protein